jgi:predicted CopG family antitoxin
MVVETANESMGDTSIRVSDELADELYSRKSRGESYEDVIWSLIERADAYDQADSTEGSNE